MRIGIDVDGVLADFNTGYIELIKEISGEDKFGPGYVPSTWNYPESVGYAKGIVDLAWQRIKQSSCFWLDLKELPDMKALKEWFILDNQVKHEVYFITSRMGQYVRLQTETWFGEREIIPTVLISSHKGLCCKALDIELYIDDKIENIESVEKDSPGTFAALFDQPWNQSYQPLFMRIKSISEVLPNADKGSAVPNLDRKDS